jgi:Tol biopolymer transport system component
MKKKLVPFLIVQSVILGGCQTSAPVPSSEEKLAIPQSSTNEIPLPPLGQQITSEGDNGESYFSPDGKWLIFQSKQRPTHENSQIYTYELSTKKEKRITHHDGDDTCSYFSPDGKKIVYASTTDEIKEQVTFEPEPPKAAPPASTPAPTASATPAPSAKKYEWKFQPYEIYLADADGSHIKRLTQSKGYDAENVFSPDGRSILFTSLRDGDLELYTMRVDARGETSKPIRLTDKKGYDGGGFYSPDGKKIVWRGFHDEKGHAQIYVADRWGKNIKTLTQAEAINWCPFWHPEGKKIIFSSNRRLSNDSDKKPKFEIYQMNADGTCLKRLTDGPGANILPSFSPDGKKISYTSNRTGKSQIYVMDYNEPKDCLPDLP